VVIDELDKLKVKYKAQELKIEALIPSLFSLKKELHEAQKKYSNLYNFNSTVYITLDKQYLIQTVNFQAALLLGLDRRQLNQKLFLNFITKKSQEVFKRSLDALCEQKCRQLCTIELITKGGNRRSVIMESILIQEDLIHLGLTDNTNILASEQQLIQLEQSLKLTQYLFQFSSEAIAALDKELHVIVLNQSFINLFSMIFATKIDIGMSLLMALSHVPDLKEKIINASQDALLGNKNYFFIENYSNKNEQYYCYELGVHAVFNAYFQKNELIIRIKDLTESKLQERLQFKKQADIAQSSRVSAMGEVASAFAHEINQPLTAIIAYSRSCLFLLNSKLEHQPTRNELFVPLEQIALQAEHAGQIIHSVNKFMREGHFYPEKTDLNLLIKEALSILEYELLEFKLKVTLNLVSDLPLIMTNKTHMMQVILNLARNSIEAFDSVVEENPELMISTERTEHHVHVHVRDNGPGIPKEIKNNILNTFFTTKPHGTGLGLGICRTLIEGHGGTLFLQEHEGGGASFTFSLPINPIGPIAHD
jgi:two-component system sensor kinase FixL